MSSEWKDPNAPRQSMKDLSWDSDIDAYSMPTLQDDEDEEDIYPHLRVPLEREEIAVMDEDEDRDTDEDLGAGLDDEPGQSPGRLEVFQQLARLLSPVLIPLLLGGITFLLTLSTMLAGRAFIHATLLLPIVLIFLALMITQGSLLFKAGSNTPLWWLHVAWGIAAFLLVGSIVVFGPVSSFFLCVGLLIIAGVVVWQYFYSVPPERVDIVCSFGKYKRTLFPGPHFLLPWEKVEHQLRTLETNWSCLPQKVPISRDQDVQLTVTVSYKLMPEDAHLVLSLHDWETTLQEYFLASIQAVANELKPEDLITWDLGPRARRAAGGHSLPPRQGTLSGGQVSIPQMASSPQTGFPASNRLILSNESSTRWDGINERMLLHIQDKVARWGIHIGSVHIRDITFLPRVPILTDTDPLLQDAGVTRGRAFASTPPLQAQVYPRQAATGTPEITGKPQKPEKPQPAASSPASTGAAQPAQPSPPPPSAAAPASSSIVNEAMLREMYDAVREGRIKDPTTIRNLALRFDALANDHEISQNIDFNAAHAAQQLYKRANMLEAKTKASAGQTTIPEPGNSAGRPLQ